MFRKIVTLAVIWIFTAGSTCLAANAKPSSTTAPPNGQAGMMAQLTKELGLSKKQSDSISAVMLKSREDIRKVWESKESEETKRKKTQTISAEAEKKFMAVLTPEQRKKLEGMRSKAIAGAGAPAGSPGGHRVGPGSPNMPERRGPGFANRVRAILKGLKLTKQQEAKTDSALKAFEKSADGIKSDTKTKPEEKRAKMETLRKTTLTKVNAALTPAQQKKLKEQMPHFFSPRPSGARK